MRALPWRGVAASLRHAAKSISLGGHALVDQLVLFADEAESHDVNEVDDRDSARRKLWIVIAPVRQVTQTSKDVLIVPWGDTKLWCEEPKCHEDYENVTKLSAASQGSYIIGAFAAYHDKNVRVREWKFFPVTHYWLPYNEQPQAMLYEQLVDEERRFSIPIDDNSGAPWAILWDARGGPRAIVPAIEDVPYAATIYPAWRWSPRGKLPVAA